jgi:hypothetical protein
MTLGGDGHLVSDGLAGVAIGNTAVFGIRYDEAETISAAS